MYGWSQEETKINHLLFFKLTQKGSYPLVPAAFYPQHTLFVSSFSKMLNLKMK